jgi:LEA14-like dessication related protein
MRELATLGIFFLLSACTLLQSDLAAPDVSVTGLRLGQSDGLSQTVLIDLMVSNPNNVSLSFNAISYRVRIEGRDLVNGTNREPLEITAGGSKKYTVPATISLMSGFGLIRDLTSRPKTKIAYELNATLEPSGLFSLPINVKKSDIFSLQ